MSTSTFDEHGITFEYPGDWDVDTDDDEGVISINLQSPETPAFAIITIDTAKPAPADIADHALEAMREEYPTLDSAPALENIGEHHAVGYDVEFFALDLTSSCRIRCFRTGLRTILIFEQWCDIEGDESPSLLAAIRSSIRETDNP